MKAGDDEDFWQGLVEAYHNHNSSKPVGPPVVAAVENKPGFKRLQHVAIPWGWVEICYQLPGKAWGVASLIVLQADLQGTAAVTLRSDLLKRCRIGRAAVHRALAALESAGLIKVGRKPGRKPRITILEQARPRPKRRRLHLVSDRSKNSPTS